MDKMIGEIQHTSPDRSLGFHMYILIQNQEKREEKSLVIHSGLIIHHNINNLLLKIDGVIFLYTLYMVVKVVCHSEHICRQCIKNGFESLWLVTAAEILTKMRLWARTKNGCLSHYMDTQATHR